MGKLTAGLGKVNNTGSMYNGESEGMSLNKSRPKSLMKQNASEPGFAPEVRDGRKTQMEHGSNIGNANGFNMLKNSMPAPHMTDGTVENFSLDQAGTITSGSHTIHKQDRPATE